MNINKAAKQLGKRGGDATKRNRGSEYYRELQKKSVAKRKENKKVANV